MVSTVVAMLGSSVPEKKAVLFQVWGRVVTVGIVRTVVSVNNNQLMAVKP